MNEQQKRNLIAQWAFDTRPVLSRFHLWLEDVDVEHHNDVPIAEVTFAPEGVARCLAMTSAVTALGTQLFGQFGEGAGADKDELNQVKKAADAISAYVTSEGLWHLTRRLPENHAIMVCLGEGLMPKAGETPEMGANPLLGFGRVYARPEVAQFVDRQVNRLLNDPNSKFEDFYERMRARGLTIWGAAVDTLENTSRFARGDELGALSVFHLFDQPLTVSRPYEAYMASLTVPGAVLRAAEERSILLDFLIPRARLVEAIEMTYPGIRRENIHVWTLAGPSREKRLSRLWNRWKALGVHLVEDGWKLPTGMPVFTESGTYAPTYHVDSWEDEDGQTHVFICDGYAATAEALQAASLSEVLDVDVSMVPYSPKFVLPYDDESRVMRLSPDDPEFDSKVSALFDDPGTSEELIEHYREAIVDAYRSNMALDRRVLHADDFLPEKQWRVLACAGYMGPDPYTGEPGVTKIDENRYRVTARIATRRASSTIHFEFRLLETFEESRLVFSPLLIRFLTGMDYKSRPVKISDSGRIRNELQTMVSPALEYRDDGIHLHFDWLSEKIMPRETQQSIREILSWYKANHPVWFRWLKID